MTRLTASADRIAQLREALDLEQERRDQMVIELRDTGSSWKTVATAARLSISRCVDIVGEHAW